MKQSETNNITLWVFFLILATAGVYLAYDYYKNKGNSLIGSIVSKTNTSIAGSGTSGGASSNAPVNSGSLLNKITPGIVNAIVNQPLTITKLENTPNTTFNPVIKGVWKNPGGTITNQITNKVYSKDSSMLLFKRNTQFNYYYVQYKNEMTWFPASEITEGAPTINIH